MCPSSAGVTTTNSLENKASIKQRLTVNKNDTYVKILIYLCVDYPSSVNSNYIHGSPGQNLKSFVRAEF